MNLDANQLRIYLPKYLTPTSEADLYAAIEQFPENIDDRIYSGFSTADTDHVYQGDGLKEMLLVRLPDPKTSMGNAMILSNTCDIAPENERGYPATICYAPIFRLDKFQESLKKRGKTAAYITSLLDGIRSQRITSIFYLPLGAGLAHESMVFLDRIISSAPSSIPKDLKTCRLFSLSQYGHYLFLVKLSIHFSRLQEGVARG